MDRSDRFTQMQYEELAQELKGILADKGQVLVAIDGCGGSGKSTFAKSLAKVGGSKFVAVEMDDFYKPSNQRSDESDQLIGGSFDWERVESQVLKPLRDGSNACYQRYDWDEDALAESHEIPHGTIVIIEGVYSTRNELMSYYDKKIWVECSHEERLQRGISRDGEESRHLWEDEWIPFNI